VVLELKDKLDEMGAGPVAASVGAVGDDVLSAMVNLGYPRPTAQKAIEAALEKTGTEDFDQLFRAAIAAIR